MDIAEKASLGKWIKKKKKLWTLARAVDGSDEWVISRGNSWFAEGTKTCIAISSIPCNASEDGRFNGSGLQQFSNQSGLSGSDMQRYKANHSWDKVW